MKIYYYQTKTKTLVTKDEQLPEFEDQSIEICIGSSATENTQMIKDASQKDYWFHLDDLPSPHGIIYLSRAGLDIGKFDFEKEKNLIYQIGILVKEHSKYKKISKLKVNYCPISKISHGNKPGQVILKKTPNTIVV